MKRTINMREREIYKTKAYNEINIYQTTKSIKANILRKSFRWKTCGDAVGQLHKAQRRVQLLGEILLYPRDH